MPQFKPAGRPDIIPRIITTEVAELVAFVQHVFGAQGARKANAPTELRLGASIIMISDGGGVREPMPCFLHVYVDDCDVRTARALAVGATHIEPPEDMPWGDRRATVRDRWGNLWQIATTMRR